MARKSSRRVKINSPAEEAGDFPSFTPSPEPERRRPSRGRAGGRRGAWERGRNVQPVQLNRRVPRWLADKVRSYATLSGRSQDEVVAEALERWLAEVEEAEGEVAFVPAPHRREPSWDAAPSQTERPTH